MIDAQSLPNLIPLQEGGASSRAVVGTSPPRGTNRSTQPHKTPEASEAVSVTSGTPPPPLLPRLLPCSPRASGQECEEACSLPVARRVRWRRHQCRHGRCLRSGRGRSRMWQPRLISRHHFSRGWVGMRHRCSRERGEAGWGWRGVHPAVAVEVEEEGQRKTGSKRGYGVASAREARRAWVPRQTLEAVPG